MSYYLDRAKQGCLCCGQFDLQAELTPISPYLAFKAWQGAPELIQLFYCKLCDFRFFGRGLTNEEAASYYASYRNEKYCEIRNKYEPFYTYSHHKKLGVWLNSDERKQALVNILKEAGVPEQLNSVLDHGGGTGHLIQWVKASRKAVFDICGDAPVSGVDSISDLSKLGYRWDLLVSAHVLEHVSAPTQLLDDMISRIAKGGYLYLELPYELWRKNSCVPKLREKWLHFIVNKPKLLMLMDVYSTICRVMTGFVPPLGFVPMREHINYFGLQSVKTLLLRKGLRLMIEPRRDEHGNILVVAQVP